MTRKAGNPWVNPRATRNRSNTDVRRQQKRASHDLIDIDAIFQRWTKPYQGMDSPRVYFAIHPDCPDQGEISADALTRTQRSLDNALRLVAQHHQYIAVEVRWRVAQNVLDLHVHWHQQATSPSIDPLPVRRSLALANPQRPFKPVVQLSDPIQSRLVALWLDRLLAKLGSSNHFPRNFNISDDRIMTTPKASLAGQSKPISVLARRHGVEPWLDQIQAYLDGLTKSVFSTRDQNTIFVFTTYALDPNRAALARLLIDLDQNFMLLPIERFTESTFAAPIKNLLLIDVAHLLNAGRSGDLAGLLSRHPKAQAVVRHPSDGDLIPDTTQVVSYQQLKQQLGSRQALLDLIEPNKTSTPISEQPLTPQAANRTAPGLTLSTVGQVFESPKTQALFDKEAAIERARGRPGLAIDLYQLLKASLPQDLTDLASAVRNNDSSQARRILHKLAGALALTGASQLEQTVEDVRLVLESTNSLQAVKRVTLSGEQLLALMIHDPWETPLS